MSPRLKYWIFLIAIALAVFAVILGSFAASWYSLSVEEQAFIRDIAPRLLPFPLFGGLFLFLIIGGLVSLLFSSYIIPILKLGEETKLISIANPQYRIKPQGAKEVVWLTRIINESAEAIETLRNEVREQIQLGQAQLTEERNRLAALMSELPSAVLVCNTDGLILLYNLQAQKLLQRPGRLIGLGRSLFNVLDREPIIHALGILQQATRRCQAAPTTDFMMTLPDGLNLRVGMAAVFAERQEKRTISGFVLTVENMTQQIEADLQHDLMFQTLTEAMRFSVSEIRQAISAILSNPEMPVDVLNEYRLTIDRASAAIEDQVQVARRDYAHLQIAREKTENVLGDYLLELLRRNLSQRLRLQVEVSSAPDLWLRVNSFAVVQGLAQLGEILKQAGMQGLSLELDSAADGTAHLRIAWPGCGLVQSTLLEWQRRPLVHDAKNRLVSFHELIEQGGGALTILPADENQCESLQLILPLSHPDEHWHDPKRPEHRPIYYEFDLFKQSGWEELGQIALNKLTFVVFDTETTGLRPSEGDEIIQIGAIRIINGRILYDEIMDQLVDPQRPVPVESTAIHGISSEMLKGQPTIDSVLPAFYHFVEGAVLVAHNAAFDMSFLQRKEKLAGVRFDHPVLDTLLLSSVVHPHQEEHSLDELARRFHVPILGRHTALGDAIVTAEILVGLIPLLQAAGINTLEEAIQASAASPFAKLSF